MKKDITYALTITTAQCFSCKESFELYDIQKTNMDFCNVCNPNNKLTQLTTMFLTIKNIVKFAEEENKKIDNKLVVDVSDLLIELQK